MKTKTNLIYVAKHMLSPLRGLATILAVGAFPVYAAQVALPGAGVELKNVQKEALKLDYDGASRKLGFDKVSATGFRLFDSCKAELKTGTNTTLLAVENWKSETQVCPVDYVLMLDDSRSMHQKHGNRVYCLEAIDFIKRMVDNLHPHDTLTLYLVAKDVTCLGEKIKGDDANARAAFQKKLDELRKNATNWRAHENANTGMLYCIETKLSEVNAQRAANRMPSFIVLADADPDKSPAESYQKVLAECAKPGKEIPISTVVYYQGVNNEQCFAYKKLCRDTKGKYYDQDAAATEQDADAISKELNSWLHKPYCQFSLSLPANVSDKSLALTFTMQGGQTDAVQILMNAEALQAICAGAPISAEVSDAVNLVKNKVVEFTPLAAALAEAEQRQPQDAAAIREAAQKLQDAAQQLLEPCRKLKAANAAEAQRAIEQRLNGGACPEQEAQALRKILAFVTNAQLTQQNVELSHVLALMGRETALPEAPAEPTLAEVQLKTLVEKINKSAETLAALQAAESAQPADAAQVRAKVGEVKALVDDAKPVCQQMKQLPQEEMRSAVYAALQAPNISQADRSVLNRILLFVDDTNITAENITDAQVLNLMGRNAPLPSPEAPAKSTDAVMLWSIGGGVALLLLLLVIFYVRHMRRLQKKNIAEFPTPEPENDFYAEPEPESNPEMRRVVSCVRYGDPVPSGERVRARIARPANGDAWAILGSLVTIGRDDSNDLVLKEDSVSGHHCTLSYKKGVWSLVDLQSANGIYANGQLHKQLVLKNGATFELGSVELKFYMEH